MEQIRQFVMGVARSAREKSSETEEYFKAVSKMASDPEAPPELRELSRVLRDYMAGVKNPDLSKLPEKLAQIVREAMEGNAIHE